MRHLSLFGAAIGLLFLTTPASADVAGTWKILGPDGSPRGELRLTVDSPGHFVATRTLPGETRNGTARRAGPVLHLSLARAEEYRGISRRLLEGEGDDPAARRLETDLSVTKGERWGDELLVDPSGATKLEPVWTTAPLSDLSPEAEAFAASRPGDTAVAVRDPRRHVVFTREGDVKIRTASIVKMIILAAIWDRATKEGRGVTAFEQQNLAPMIQHSDNDATTRLFNSLGGRSGLQPIVDKTGMTSTVPNGAWGYTDTTAPDMALLAARIYDRSLLGLAPSDAALALLSSIDPGQSFGVKEGVPGTAFVAFKNGWYPETENGVWRVNSVGAVRDTSADVGYSLAVLTRYPIGKGEAFGHDTTTELSRLVYAAESKRGEVVPPADPVVPPTVVPPTVVAPPAATPPLTLTPAEGVPTAKKGLVERLGRSVGRAFASLARRLFGE